MTDTNNTPARALVFEGVSANGVSFKESAVDLMIGSTGAKAKYKPVPVTINLADLPAASVAFALTYGLRQYIADGAAGSEDQKGYEAGIEARLDKLFTGDFSRTRGAGEAKPDSTESRARKLASAFLRERAKEAGIKADVKALNEAAVRLVGADPKWAKMAAKQLADEAKLREDGESDVATDVMADIMASLGGAGGTEGEANDEEG